MKWFYKWLNKKISDSITEEDDYSETRANIGTIKTTRKSAGNRLIGVAAPSESLATDPITFKMYKASGGWAIEFKLYDSKTDRVDQSLYVVNNEQDLGEHISKIITMEALKR
jgi:hypothetical protein